MATKNANRKPTPDLMGGALAHSHPKQLRKKRSRTASQIADSIEAEAKRLKGVADILRGKT